MKENRFSILIILAVFVVSLLVSLPRTPINFSLFNNNFSGSIGGYSLDFNLFGKEIKRDLELKQGLDLRGGLHVTLRADMSKIPQDQRRDALDSAQKVIERRVNFFGVSEANVQTSKAGEDYRIIVEIPGLENSDQALGILGQTAQLDFREFIPSADASPSAYTIPTYQNTVSTNVTGKDLKSARTDFNPQTGAPEVAFEMTPEGAVKFEEVTKRLIGKQLAVFLDNVPLTWPTVNSPISDKGVISGSFTVDQVNRLVLQLKAGALPVPVKVIEQKQIGASLGRESIEKSIVAGVIGLLLVAGFMLLNYGRLGLIADFALLSYGLITLAVYKLIPVVFTLPGVAGFMLSMGMAVDANILIFERLKEELRLGRPLRSAIEVSFSRSWDSIRDANACTIIISLILLNPLNYSFLNSSGPVRGFALTLLLGVLISLFTGIIVTRNLVRVFFK